jgi:carboxynorspermidine decarboxylase
MKFRIEMVITTPYYLIDEKKLLRNLRIIEKVRTVSGAKSLLALKCFSTWCVFDLMSRYMDGTTSSSLYEVKLGHDKFGGETHAYSVAFALGEIRQVRRYADKVIFNSLSQLEMYKDMVAGIKVGLRVNPGFSYSHFDLADPARRYSRLGVPDKKSILKAFPYISGCMFHFNCENDDFDNFSNNLDLIGRTWGDVLEKCEWISLGGGLYFTKPQYPVEKFAKKLREFSTAFNIQIYLEPGESAITQSTELVTTVLDIVNNGVDIAVVDASIEAHMPDLLVYRQEAKMKEPRSGAYRYMIAGRSCLAGDVFGTYTFRSRLKVGSEIRFADAAGYTMVKKNWFNGLPMPSVVVKKLDGSYRVVRRFDYESFVGSLS